MAADDLYFATLTYCVSVRAFGIISMDSSQSYEEQILKENLLAYLAQIAHVQYRTIRKIITEQKEQGDKTFLENCRQLLERYHSKAEEAVSLTNRVTSFLKREIAAILRYVFCEASQTMFYRIVDLSEIYREYSKLRNTGTGTGTYSDTKVDLKYSMRYIDFISDIHNVILSTTNRRLILLLYNYFARFYSIKYPQLFYMRKSATGTVLTIDEHHRLDQQYKHYVETLKEQQVYCSVCHIEVHTEADMLLHVSGRRHKATVRRGVQKTNHEHYNTFSILHKALLLASFLKKEISLTISYNTVENSSTQNTSQSFVDYYDDNYDNRINNFTENLIELSYKLTVSLNIQISNDIYLPIISLLPTGTINTNYIGDTAGKITVKKPIIDPNTGEEIPKWQYDAHGLHRRFLCEVCGELFYYGQKVFDKHFLERQHIAGLEALGINGDECKRYTGLTTRAAVLDLKAAMNKTI